MNWRSLTQAKSSFTPVQAGLLQRKCESCGQHTIAGGECVECRKKRQTLQADSFYSRGREIEGEVGVPPIAHEVLHSPGQLPDQTARAFMEPHFGHDFRRVPVGIPSYFSNGSEDDEGEESINLRMPSASQSPIQPQPTPLCPVNTQVDNVTDLTQAGLQAGFLSAYGIIARMRVLPDRTTWDGRQVTEFLTQTSSTCPPGLTSPGPCHGNSTFTVGAASGASGVIPQQPAMRNRFYDFHTSRSRRISFLHDATRNPAGINSCEVMCQQEYLCNNKVIGTHRIARQFRKGTFNGRNVTIIDVTKQDNPSEPGDFPMRTLPPGQEYASRTEERGEVA